MGGPPHELEFVDIGPRRGTRTKRWLVKSARNGRLLGAVAFKAHWRRHVFYPGTGTLFDANCLRELAEHLDAATAEQRQRTRGGST